MEQIQLWVTEHLPLIISYAVIVGEAVGILLLKLAMNVIKAKMTAGITGANKKAEEFFGEIARQKADFEKKIKVYRERAEKIEKQNETLIKMLKIGFGNDTNLVRSGYAREIMKVADENAEPTADEIKQQIDAAVKDGTAGEF